MSTAAGDRDEREGANRLNLHEIHRCVPDALMTARTTARKYMPSRTARSVKDIAAITAANKAATTPATTVTTIRRRSRLHPLTDSWEERTAGRNCTCNEQACNRVCRQCLVIGGRCLSPCVEVGSLSGKLSPGCRAVELSRLRRAAVEAAVEVLSRPCLSSLSSSCRVAVE